MTEKRITYPVLRPFSSVPDVRRYFPASVMEESRERLSRAISRSEGPAQLIGAAGMGKSLMLEVLAEQFKGQLSVVALIGAQLCTRRALLQMILFELKLPFRGMDEGELRLSLVEYLRGGNEGNQKMLLLVDEADALPSRLLHELRVLTNVSDQGQPLVSLVLAGSSILEERFADPEMEVFNQRISARCYLSPLRREETFGYVHSHIEASGGDVNALFSADGLESIFTVTDGIPRLINQLGDQLIWMAQETGYQPLDGEIVQQAWSEIQQLPAPWNQSVLPTHASQNEVVEESSVVEFGELDSPMHAEQKEAIDSSCQDSCSNEEEEMPASIPFEIQFESRLRSSEEVNFDSIDAAEQLLQGIDDSDGGPLKMNIKSHEVVGTDQGLKQSQDVQVDWAPKEAYDPFAESYASEEVVIDQYLSFDSPLLTTAVRVINRDDVSFANDLERCVYSNSQEKQLPTSGRDFYEADQQSVEDEGLLPLQPVEQAQDKARGPLENQSTSPSQVPQQVSQSTVKSRPAVLVQGQHFRQLFNQLGARRPSTISG